MISNLFANLVKWKKRYGLTSITFELSVGVAQRQKLVLVCKKVDKEARFVLPNNILKSTCDTDTLVDMFVKSQLSKLIRS